MKRHWMALVGAVVALFLVVGLGSGQLGKILKGGAVVLLVRQFGKDINNVINTALMNRKWEHRQATKVVPIVSIGSGAYVGAAQVSGDEKDVAQVEGVAQIEVDLPGRTRGKILIPVDNVTVNPTEMKRVYGVGVSAVIDIRL
ncbi:MAG: hypothetical protein NZ959_01325 [Armatimonadetes bacterium]|nr:hypothetical protein [Armatimonadota bacterium]MDW8122112.1 hypothetical protein [Armatimonadota bacterium]